MFKVLLATPFTGAYASDYLRQRATGKRDMMRAAVQKAKHSGRKGFNLQPARVEYVMSEFHSAVWFEEDPSSDLASMPNYIMAPIS
jgi:hypothetical protein